MNKPDTPSPRKDTFLRGKWEVTFSLRGIPVPKITGPGRARTLLGALHALSEALDQQGGENAVHFFLFLRFFVLFLPFSTAQPNDKKFLPSLQGVC